MKALMPDDLPELEMLRARIRKTGDELQDLYTRCNFFQAALVAASMNALTVSDGSLSEVIIHLRVMQRKGKRGAIDF